MLERLRHLERRLRESPGTADEPAAPALAPVRLAAAQLFIATGAIAAFERTRRTTNPGHLVADHHVPRPLAWAPLLLAPLAAAAQLEHARNPREETAAAVRVLNGASIALGGALMLYDLVAPSDSPGPPRLGPLAFASAGLLGVAIERHDRRIRRAENQLRRRADLVERLVPRRRAKLDRIVVHV